jgi:hypothetical protein
VLQFRFEAAQAGQAAWLRELLRFGNNNPNVEGFFYWASDYYPGLGGASTMPAPQYEGLFASPNAPVPALAEFGMGRLADKTTTDCLFDWAQRSYTDAFANPATATLLYGP